MKSALLTRLCGNITKYHIITWTRFSETIILIQTWVWKITFPSSFDHQNIIRKLTRHVTIANSEHKWSQIPLAQTQMHETEIWAHNCFLTLNGRGHRTRSGVVWKREKFSEAKGLLGAGLTNRSVENITLRCFAISVILHPCSNYSSVVDRMNIFHICSNDSSNRIIILVAPC